VESNQLTIVIPVSSMAGKLTNLRLTLGTCIAYPINIVLVHDVCDEETGPELRKIVKALKSDQIKVIEGRFGSPGVARNAGIEIAKTDWLGFWDSDDLPNVDGFMNMLHEAINASAEISIGGISTTIYGNERETNYHPAFAIHDDQDLFNLALMPAFTRMIFKRSIIELPAFPPLSMGEDLIFLARIRLLDRKILIFNQNVYLYILGFPGQLTESRSKLKQVEKAWHLIYLEMIQSHGPMRKYLLFQLYRIFGATIKYAGRSDLQMLRKMISIFITSPLLSKKIIFHIITSRGVIGARSSH
jgi:glycosyltransferase involved in cell wall biosynthesis